MDLVQAAALIKKFDQDSLSCQINKIEKQFAQKDSLQIDQNIRDFSVTLTALEAALTFKKAAGQINVVIHAMGILLSLPSVIEENEFIQYLSLGAGNTGKLFDLETDRRVAEYKFIQWQGGAETIRQNQIFKDYFYLAEYNTDKKKNLFVLDKEIPLRFFHGRRALNSIISTNKKVENRFRELYSNRFAYINEYFRYREKEVEIIDLLEILPKEISNIFLKLK